MKHLLLPLNVPSIFNRLLKSQVIFILLLLVTISHVQAQFSSVVKLNSVSSVTAATAEKPQAKVWNYAGLCVIGDCGPRKLLYTVSSISHGLVHSKLDHSTAEETYGSYVAKGQKRSRSSVLPPSSIRSLPSTNPGERRFTSAADSPIIEEDPPHVQYVPVSFRSSGAGVVCVEISRRDRATGARMD